MTQQTDYLEESINEILKRLESIEETAARRPDEVMHDIDDPETKWTVDDWRQENMAIALAIIIEAMRRGHAEYDHKDGDWKVVHFSTEKRLINRELVAINFVPSIDPLDPESIGEVYYDISVKRQRHSVSHSGNFTVRKDLLQGRSTSKLRPSLAQVLIRSALSEAYVQVTSDQAQLNLL